MQNTDSQKVTETTEQEVQTTGSEETVDYEALYKAEVKNAQKLRKRSQEVESKLTNYETKQVEVEEAKLKEEGEFKTLLEKRDTEIKDLKVKAQAYDDMLQSERNTILENMTDEDKEQFGDLPLTQLKAINKKLNDSQPVKKQSEILSNAVNNPTKDLPKDWTKMDDKERRENWDQIVASARKN